MNGLTTEQKFELEKMLRRRMKNMGETREEAFMYIANYIVNRSNG